MDSRDSEVVEPTGLDHEGKGGFQNDPWLLAGEPGMLPGRKGMAKSDRPSGMGDLVEHGAWRCQGGYR